MSQERLLRLLRLSHAMGLGDPASVLDRLYEVYGEIDREVAERTSALELPCFAGCDACCHEAVFVSAPEFLGVAAHLLATRPRHELIEIQRAMLDLAERYEDELELLETLRPGGERDEVAARVKFACPLLSSGGWCTIYPARELNARTFGASWDTARGEPYGCELTRGRLRVLGSQVLPSLPDARGARARLTRSFPGVRRVHVFPWWFRGFGAFLL